MRCIFCKKDSSTSKSVEHIIPESLGNKNHILRPGIVCDKCNQYIAIKIEKPVLEKSYFTSVRHRNSIASKKNKIPFERAIIGKDSNVQLDVNDNGYSVLIENSETINKILSGQINRMYVPIIGHPAPNDKEVSKFLGKIAIEGLAQRLINVEGWQDELVDNKGLDELRNYVRYGAGHNFWPYYQRRIYREGFLFKDEKTNDSYEILHEFDFLYPDKPEIVEQIHVVNNLYFVCAIMGIEYTINLTNAGLERYISWLKDNNHKSILMMKKSEFNTF